MKIDSIFHLQDLHFLTILALGISASAWSVSSAYLLPPIIWLCALTFLVIYNNVGEFKFLFRRFLKIGASLILVSLLQIIFIREGNIILAWHQFPLIYSRGLMEAFLLWIRFMILFMLAYTFTNISLFNFLLVLNKWRVSFKMSILLLNTFKLLPFVFNEANRSLWFMRFRGIQIGRLTVRQKLIAFRKIIFALLMQTIHYTSYSALALELRGYGIEREITLQNSYPMHKQDYLFFSLILMLNIIAYSLT